MIELVFIMVVGTSLDIVPVLIALATALVDQHVLVSIIFPYSFLGWETQSTAVTVHDGLKVIIASEKLS